MDANLKHSIDALHGQIVESAHSIVSTLVDNGKFSTAKSNEMVFFASQLWKIAPEESKPKWLISFLEQFGSAQLSTQYANNLASECAIFVISNMPAIEVPILTPDEVNYDFDLAFNDVRESRDIRATFENLVAKLEEIIATDLVDSRVVQQALERLAALLKRNKNGSLASILVTIHYGRFALKAFGGALAANKYLKPMLEAFIEEFKEAESKVQKAENALKNEAVLRLTNQERLKAYLAQSGTEASDVAGYLTLDDGSGDAAE